MTAPGPLQQIQATVWKMMEDLSWKMLIQLRHLLWLGIQILRIHLFSFGHTGKSTFSNQAIEKMQKERASNTEEITFMKI